MNANQLSRLVTKLRLPALQFVIIGSGNLAMRGIRPTEDLDLFVTPAIYAVLKQKYGGEVHQYGQTYLEFFVDGIQVDAHAEWKMPGYQPQFKKYLQQPEVIDGLPFMPLKDLYDWKAATRRDKDVADLKLIKDYWSKQAEKA